MCKHCNSALHDSTYYLYATVLFFKNCFWHLILLCNQIQILRLIPCVIDLKAHYKFSQFQDVLLSVPLVQHPILGQEGGAAICLSDSLPSRWLSGLCSCAGRRPCGSPWTYGSCSRFKSHLFLSGILSTFILDLWRKQEADSQIDILLC